MTANPNTLWPPNHKMETVTLSVEGGSGSQTCKVVKVESNEPINGLGEGDTEPDWEIVGDLTVKLRRERSGQGSGRIYTITVECTDSSGNKSTGQVTVKVPLNQGQ